MRKQLVIVIAMLAACSSKPAPRQPSPMAGALERGMANCPSAIEGAETRLQMTPGGVDVIVTAKDARVQAEIVRIAEIHAGQVEIDGQQHTGRHGGPGTIGHCPVIHEGTWVATSRVEGGAVLHVTALQRGLVRSIQDQTAQRLAAMPKKLARAAQP